MRAWFYGLQTRERLIVGIGVAAAALIVVWGFVVTPLRGEIAVLRASVDAKQRLLVDLARIESEQPGAVTGNRQGAQQTLVVVVDTTARGQGLDLSRTTANGPSGVNVSFQGASFDALVAWLIELSGTYGIDVETASVFPAREAGLVNGQLSLRRL